MKNQNDFIVKNAAAVAQGAFKIASLRDGVVTRETPWMANKVQNGTNTGIQLLIAAMAGLTTNPVAIDTLSIGTGTSERTTSMTDLETPVLENVPFATRIASGNEWQGEFFILDAELANQTYNELGIFAAGNLYATALIENGYSKVDGEDLLISYKTSLLPA